MAGYPNSNPGQSVNFINDKLSTAPTPAQGATGPMFNNFNPLAAPASSGTDYGSAFQNALNQARGNIQQQLGASLADIANSQQQAGIALGQMPGQINQAFDASQAAANNAQKVGQGVFSQWGFGQNGALPVSAMMAPEMAAVNNTRNADLANVPLLQAGINQETARARTQANNAAMDRYSQLDQSQAQYDQAQAAAQQAQQYAQANAYQDYLYKKSLNDQQNTAAMQQYQASQDQAQAKSAPGYTVYGNQTVSNADIQKAQNSPQFARIMALLGSYKKGSKEQQNQWSSLQHYYGDNPALLAAVNAAK